MWRYPFLNFCFLFLVLALLTLQHSFPVSGPFGHSTGTDSDRSQIFDLASEANSSTILRPPEDFSRAVAYLSDLWRRGMVLKEWTIEANAFQWELFRASSPAETGLLNARFHVANAEVFTEAMPGTIRAIRELDRAEASLKAAENIVEPRLIGQMKTIDDEITTVETREQSEDAFSTMPFENIKAHLDHLIAIVRSTKISGESSRTTPIQG